MSWTMVWFATWPAWETFWARHAERLSRLLLRTPQPDMGVAWHNFSFQNLSLDGFPALYITSMGLKRRQD